MQEMNETGLGYEKRKEGEAVSQLVTFKLGQEEYGIDIMRVQEIILRGEITKVPEVPEYIEGVINLRGNVIPIIDLRRLFHVSEKEPTEETRVVVINILERTMGITVDAVCEVLRISEHKIEPPPPAISSVGKQCIKGLVKLETHLLILLDIEKILSMSDQG
jgi:purine-binding chemotaxis protein CheW